MSLLLEAYDQLPARQSNDDPDLYRAGVGEAIEEFYDLVRERYTEGTLGRMLTHHLDVRARRAAAVALGLIGTFVSNSAVALALKDDDDQVRGTAADALWDIWFRGDGGTQGMELRRALALPDVAERLPALDDLSQKYPDFAEIYNQRAIQHFGCGQYAKAVADCETTLRYNPHHFGAAAGLGQCYLRMNKPGAAVRAVSQALDINPEMDSLRDVMNTLRGGKGEE